MPNVEGYVVVVTGASSGLGAQLARALATAGAVPVLAARRAERLAALRDEIPGADTITCDVTDEDDRRRLIDTVMERHGRIDGLVNNAGAGATAPALRTTTETFARVVDLNLVAPFGLSCLAAEQMRAGDGGGRVRRVEGRRDRPHPRACVAVGSLRDPRERGGAGVLRIGDDRGAR
jgi:NAD(P)-dependent dehydrogenase (short-subunit alcohol dehydrogenase family)